MRTLKPKYAQLKNPVTKRWVKIDTVTGKLVANKKSAGQYKNIPLL